MYKKSGTEESFLYDDKKGLEFSVLRNNEFLEKIKIKSEKLEEDYKTTINISEQNNEGNEFFLSKIKLIFFQKQNWILKKYITILKKIIKKIQIKIFTKLFLIMKN